MAHLEINKEKIIGNGSYGQVFYGTYFKSPAAVKTLKNMTFTEEFKKEVQLLT
jgi:predicted Ser/Thr protein kinase